MNAVLGSVHLITHRNKPENYFVALLVIMVVWLIRGVLLIRQFLDSCIWIGKLIYSILATSFADIGV